MGLGTCNKAGTADPLTPATPSHKLAEDFCAENTLFTPGTTRIPDSMAYPAACQTISITTRRTPCHADTTQLIILFRIGAFCRVDPNREQLPTLFIIYCQTIPTTR